VKSTPRFPWLVVCLVLTFLVLGRVVRVDGSWFIWHHSVLEEGQWWRLLTGHWVHFTPSHVLQNVAVFSCCGAFLERRGHLLFLLVLLVSSLVISLGLIVCDPGLAFYGGLSGINHGLLFLVGLVWLRSGHRGFAFALWGLLMLKLGLEFGGLKFSLVSLAGTEIRPVPMAHLLGLVSCVALVPVWLRLDSENEER